MPLKSVVVVGGSLAGLRAVEALRRRGYDGKTVWIGAERHLPYDRPPLSKQLLDGTWNAERVFFRQREGYEGLAADLRFGVRAVSLDTTERRVLLDDGSAVPYDGLVIATGARPRSLPFENGLTNVFSLRTLDDAQSIRNVLERSPRVVVIGAGFIGLEVASACRKLGLSVTIVEPLETPLIRQLGAWVGTAIEHIHRDEGVQFALGRSAVALEGEDHVSGVVLDDGTRLQADLVVVGIGVTPVTDWLSRSAVRQHDGVVCDCRGSTGVPRVVAAGDVARWENPLFEASVRVEHWANAVEQANTAVGTLLDGEGAVAPMASVPYFWSDQHGVKLQFVGHHLTSDRAHVVEAVSEARRCTVLFERDGRATGALLMNRPAAAINYRKLLGERVSIETALDLARANAGT